MTTEIQTTGGAVMETSGDWRALQGAIAAVANHPICQNIFSAGKSEVSVFSKIAGTDALGKCRIDWLPAGDCLTDIKTVPGPGIDKPGGASEERFSTILFSLRYYTQAAWYLDRWNAANPDDQRHHFVFVAVEKEPPYLVKPWFLDEEGLALGRKQNARDVLAYSEAKRSGVWGGYGERCERISIPKWASLKLTGKGHDEWLKEVAAALAADQS